MSHNLDPCPLCQETMVQILMEKKNPVSFLSCDLMIAVNLRINSWLCKKVDKWLIHQVWISLKWNNMGFRYSNGKTTWIGGPFEYPIFWAGFFSVRFSDHHSKTGQFDNQTPIYHLNTGLVQNYNGYCICFRYQKEFHCLRKIPLWETLGSPWKEGEIRLELDKIISESFISFFF